MTTTALPTRAPAAAPTRLSDLALLTLLLGPFLSITDFFIVNVALTDIQSDLRTSTATLEMVVSGYAVAYALLLVAGGRLGDAYGRKRLYLAGMAAFTVASLACGLAPTGELLVATRIAQGAAAALMVPQVMATIQAVLTGPSRLRALGWFGAAAGLSMVVGQLLGGFLVSADIAGTGWRLIFLVNVPLGLAGLVLAGRMVPDTRSDDPARHDWLGTALLGVALVALLVPLMEGRVLGWPAWCWVSLAVAPVAFAGFLAVEHRLERRGETPLLPLSLVAMPSMYRGLLIQVPFFVGFSGFMFCYTVMAQVGLRLEPVQTGLVLVPLGATFLVASAASARLVVRLGRGVITVGAAIQALGLGLTAWLVAVQWPEVSLPALGLTLAVAGVGQGMLVSPLFGVIISRVPAAAAGAGSGVLNTAQQISFALGVATVGNLFLAFADRPGSNLGTAFVLVLTIQIVMAGVVALLSRTLPPAR
ncbi:MAG: MFS transporter [Micromonosporaceae bacterium]